MSARTRRTKPAAAPPPRPRSAPRWPAVALGLALAGIAVFVVLRQRAAHAPAAADPLAGMPAEEALRTGLQLERGQRHLESLPYFRHGFALMPDAPAAAHGYYGIALYNAVFQLDMLAGLSRPVWPTSVERVAAMRECLGHMSEATRLAPNLHDRAFYMNRTARMLQVWGFQYETLIWYRRAADAEPTNATYAGQANGYVDMLRDPVHAAQRLARTAPDEH